MEMIKTGGVLDKMPENMKPYAEAMQTPYIRDMKKAEAVKAIYQYIVMAIEFTGSKVKTEDANATLFIAENLYFEINLKLPLCRICEVKNALKNGCFGEYGEFFGINVANCYKWVKSYLNSKEKQDSVKEFHRLLDERDGVNKSDKPVLDIFNSPEVIAGINEMYGKFLKGEVLPPYARIYYDFICQHKQAKSLITDESIRKSIRELAKKEYEAHLKSKRYDKNEPDLYDTLMNHFYGSKTYESYAKKIALIEYFKECKQKNINPI